MLLRFVIRLDDNLHDIRTHGTFVIDVQIFGTKISNIALFMSVQDVESASAASQPTEQPRFTFTVKVRLHGNLSSAPAYLDALESNRFSN